MQQGRLGTPNNPVFWQHEGRQIPVVLLGRVLRPYVISQEPSCEDALIIVTEEGPFDAEGGDLTAYRHTHWDGGWQDVWRPAFDRLQSGGYQPVPLPTRDDHQGLRYIFQYLSERLPHPRWNLIMGTTQQRREHTLAMHMRDARRQIELEGASGILLQDHCGWCGQPTSRTCDGFLTAGFQQPYLPTAPFFRHSCGAPVCGSCDAVFETCFGCSFWTGLPVPIPRLPLPQTGSSAVDSNPPQTELQP